MAQSLKSKSAKGFAWDFGGSLLQQGSTFIVSIFLARILGPKDFGLVGMAMVFITTSQVFIDVGFASGLIQRQDNTKLTYSSVFYMNLFLGFLLTLIFYLSAPFIGAFYKNPQITSLVRWLSLIFVFNSLDIVQVTILKKSLNFKTLNLRTFIANVIGGILGIIAAYLGFGVYSLVIKSLFTACLGTSLLWKTSQWRPDFKFSIVEIKKLSGFSAFVFFDRTLVRFVQQLDVLMVGKVFNSNMLGYYTRATSLRDLVTTYSSTSLTNVFYPVLSSLQNNDREYSNIYFKVVSVITFISYALTGLMCILGRDIIILLFGLKWEPSVPIFQIIILMACNTPLNSMMINAFYSKGKSKANFWVGVLNKTIRLFPLIVMYYYGMYYFTIAFVIINYIITIINVFFLKEITGLSYKKHFQKIFEGILPTGIVLAAFFYADVQTTWGRLMWAIAFAIIYFVFCKVKRTEGFQFIASNIPLIKKKINVFQKRAMS
jgi:O-antigen/teichoic acid export membrane protein